MEHFSVRSANEVISLTENHDKAGTLHEKGVKMTRIAELEFMF